MRLLDNPLLAKELRTRMRGGRAAWILLAYLGSLSFILFFAYFSWYRSAYRYGGAAGLNDLSAPGGAAFDIGSTFYQVLFTVQALLVGLITPALTAGAVSIEREQRTFELLSVSLLPRRSIVLGKLAAAVAFVSLLLASSLPLVSLCFLLGGVSPGEVGASFALLVLTAFVYGAAGVAWSTIARNTTTATVLAYGTAGLFFFATLPLAIPNAPGFYSGVGGLLQTGLRALNPVGAVFFGTATEEYFGRSIPAWLPAAAVLLLLGATLTVTAVHRLEQPRADRSGWLRLLTAALTALVFACLYGFLLPRGQGAQGGLPAIRLSLAYAATVFLPCVLVPIFATAEGLPARGGVLSSMLDPRRLVRGEAPSGLLFVLLAVLLCCGPTLLLGAPTGETGDAARVLGLSLAFAFGVGGVGLLLSVLLANRWSAAAATAMFALLAFFGPTDVQNRWARPGWRPSAVDSVLYLSPQPAARALGDPNALNAPGPLRLWFGNGPSAAVTSALYAALGLASCLLAAVLDARLRAKGRPRERTAAQPQDAGAAP